MASLGTALILFFVFCFEPVKAEYCYDSNSFYDDWNWKTCPYGCCTSSYDGCCSFTLTGWMIGLIVSGSIVFICVIVAVVCCCVKSQGQAGRVVQPVPHSGVNVISTAQNSSTMQYQQQQGYYGPPQGPYGPSQGFSYSSGPPGYTQAYGPPPGPPAYSDPAFPPGQTNMPASTFASAAGKSAN